MDAKNLENENNGTVSINAKERKNKTNEKLKMKRQEKVLKVRKKFQDRLSSKLTFFQSLEVVKHEKTPRKHGVRGVNKSEARDNTDSTEMKQTDN